MTYREAERQQARRRETIVSVLPWACFAGLLIALLAYHFLG